VPRVVLASCTSSTGPVTTFEAEAADNVAAVFPAAFVAKPWKLYVTVDERALAGKVTNDVPAAATALSVVGPPSNCTVTLVVVASVPVMPTVIPVVAEPVVWSTGAAGRTTVVTLVEAADEAEFPQAFVAVTVNVSPTGLRCVQVAVVAVGVAKVQTAAPAGFAVTV
jgi:hypothetical protein